MTLRLSKVLLAIEAIVLVAPITLLFSSIASEMLMSSLRFKSAWQIELLSLTIIATSLAGGWVLMIGFWRHGSAGLRTDSSIAWVLVLCGAISTLLAVASLATGIQSLLLPGVDHVLGAFVWGLPLLVPLCHLLAERFLRSQGS